MEPLDECPAAELAAAVDALKNDTDRGLERVEELLDTYGRDARLHFLRGSVLAGMGRFGEAHQAMRAAVDIAPDYAVARFQLGFLEFTSGDAAAATATWQRLQQRQPDDALRLFALGLQSLARDEFAQAVATLELGITRNTENPAMSRDMQLIIDTAREKLGEVSPADEPTSSAHLLLQQSAAKATKH